MCDSLLFKILFTQFKCLFSFLSSPDSSSYLLSRSSTFSESFAMSSFFWETFAIVCCIFCFRIQFWVLSYSHSFNRLFFSLFTSCNCLISSFKRSISSSIFTLSYLMCLYKQLDLLLQCALNRHALGCLFGHFLSLHSASRQIVLGWVLVHLSSNLQ